MRRLADNMVQLGKEVILIYLIEKRHKLTLNLAWQGTLSAARRAAAFVRGDDVIHKLFHEFAYRYKLVFCLLCLCYNDNR